MRIYTLGDIHGRFDLLKAAFYKIDRDVLARPVARPVEILLGDYVNRGPNSKGVIDLLLKRRAIRQLVCLRGNHERVLLDFLNQSVRIDHWLQFGGLETLQSYGVRIARSGDPYAPARAFAAALPEEHLAFLTGLPCSYECGDYFFVHAGVRPGVPLSKQAEEDMLWIREPFLSTSEYFGKRIIHGHTASVEPEIRPNRIGIDTGAYATSRLTCLVIEHDGLRFL